MTGVIDIPPPLRYVLDWPKIAFKSSYSYRRRSLASIDSIRSTFRRWSPRFAKRIESSSAKAPIGGIDTMSQALLQTSVATARLLQRALTSPGLWALVATLAVGGDRLELDRRPRRPGGGARDLRHRGGLRHGAAAGGHRRDTVS